ncbi:MAG: TfoX/Sxy family protein [Betaproteobacteria bacterium]
MAYNKRLEEKIDDAVKRWKNLDKKKMFGGICYLLKGNMCFGIWKDFLIVRTGKELGEKSLKDKNVEPFAITGKPMSGWIMVKETGWKGRAGLAKWINAGRDYARSLPEKKKKVRAKKTLREYQA